MTATIDLTTGPDAATQSPARAALSGRWPLATFGAAVTTVLFTTVSSHFLTEDDTSGGVAAVFSAVEGDGGKTHLGVVAGFLSVLLLAAFAVGFGRFLSARAGESSTAAQLARLGLGASVATVTVAAALKAVYRGGLPDHMDSVMYTPDAVVTLQILVDQYQWAAYWPLVLVFGSCAVLGLRDRLLPRWFGGLSAVVTLFVLGMTMVLGLPYSAGLITPVWLVAAGAALLTMRRRLA